MRPVFPLHFVLFQIYNKLTAGCGEDYLQKTIKLQGTIYYFAEGRYQDFCNYNNCYVKLTHICFNVLPLAFKNHTQTHFKKHSVSEKLHLWLQTASRWNYAQYGCLNRKTGKKKGGEPSKNNHLFQQGFKKQMPFHNSIPKKRNYLHRSWYFADWKCYSSFPQLLL